MPRKAYSQNRSKFVALQKQSNVRACSSIKVIEKQESIILGEYTFVKKLTINSCPVSPVVLSFMYMLKFHYHYLIQQCKKALALI
jgi:hypothetical protein